MPGLPRFRGDRDRRNRARKRPRSGRVGPSRRQLGGPPLRRPGGRVRENRRRTEFDADHLREVCEREGLLLPARAVAAPETQLAITTFARYAAHPEDDENWLNLVPLFEGRSLAPGLTWDGDVAFL